WRRTNEGRFQLKPLGCIVQKVLRNIKPQAIFLKGLHVRWFVTEDIPSVLALPCWRHGQRHWAIMLSRDGVLVPAIRLPPGHGEPLALTAAMPASIEPKAALDANPPMQAQPLEIGHQLGISTASIGEKNHFAATRQQQGRSMEQLLVSRDRHLRAAVCE